MMPSLDFYSDSGDIRSVLSSGLSFIAMLGIQKLLNKLFPLIEKDNKIVEILSENDINNERNIKGSIENLICTKQVSTNTSNKYLKILFKQTKFYPNIRIFMIILSLPVICGFLYLFYFSIHFVEITVNSVSNTVPFNPCNETDSKTIESFKMLWKERNEAQVKLDRWTNIVAENDVPLKIKEYFMQKIQTADEQIKATNATLNPEFHAYNECFSKTNTTKRNIITFYCTATWIFFNICMTICSSLSIYCSKFLYSNYGPIDSLIKLEIVLIFLLILFGPFSLYLNTALQEMMMQSMPQNWLYT